MVDFLKNDIKIGDNVVFMFANLSTHYLKKGVVIGFSPCKVRILHDGHYDSLIYPKNIVVIKGENK